MLPIAFICWIRGRLFGLIAAVFAAAAWYAADIMSSNEYAHHFIVIWNTLVRFTFFIIVGNLQGNILLKTIAQALSASVRSSDTPARMGGDEFVLLLINSDEHQAKSAMEKIVKQITVVIKKNTWPVSLSVSVVTYKKLPASLDEVIRTADNLMYEVKAAGENDIYYKIID